MRTCSLLVWLVVVLCIHHSSSDSSMAECQVRCPDGRICVRPEGSNLHLCIRPSSSSARRERGFGIHRPRPSSRVQAGAGLIMQEGRGQASCPRPPVPAGPCVVQCTYDSDCQENQACCSTGCGSICDFLEPGAMTKPGSCPLLRGLEREQCGAQCRGDRECPGHSKCCRTRCGLTCQAPCFHWLSPTSLNNPWRLSHRCSPASD